MSTVIIGIDPGVVTGVGAIDGPKKMAKSMPIHKAMVFIANQSKKGRDIHIRVEDARQRKWFGKNAADKKQGAGSIKRDCKIWEDFLSDLKDNSSQAITFEMVHPIKGGTKINSKLFKQISGIDKETNEHGRDAYMLIHDYKIRT